jgi:hypothetical protein
MRTHYVAFEHYKQGARSQLIGYSSLLMRRALRETWEDNRLRRYGEIIAPRGQDGADRDSLIIRLAPHEEVAAASIAYGSEAIVFPSFEQARARYSPLLAKPDLFTPGEDEDRSDFSIREALLYNCRNSALSIAGERQVRDILRVQGLSVLDANKELERLLKERRECIDRRTIDRGTTDRRNRWYMRR